MELQLLPDPARKLPTNLYDIRVYIAECTGITPNDGQRNCPKYVEFHFQNKFERLVHLVGFIVRKFTVVIGNYFFKLYVRNDIEIKGVGLVTFIHKASLLVFITHFRGNVCHVLRVASGSSVFDSLASQG
jgi:hypothetical protein